MSKKPSAGVVVALKGAAAGLSKTAFTAIAQDSAGVPGSSESGDAFGSSLAAGDVTGDGYGDVLVGSPGEGIGSTTAAGMVTLLPGGSAGLTGTGSTGLDQNSAAVPDTAESFDRFGQAVAILNLDGVGSLDAIVGAPGETLDVAGPTGSITTFIGATTTLIPAGVWNYSTLTAAGNDASVRQLGAVAVS